MELTLSRRRKIKDLKKQFAEAFPFLKLEFYPARHQKGARSVLDVTLPDAASLSDLSAAIQDDVFTFTPATTVADFEQRLQNDWGLPVQVFRKSGNLWLETAQTDNLSLEKQNRMGRESERPVQFNLHTLFL